MITRTKIGLLVGLMVVSLASSAMAQVLCLQTTVNKRTLRATHKSVVAANCPSGYTQLADTSRFQGPAGPAGAKGIVNFAGCRFTTNSCSHSPGLNSCDTKCNAGEFVLHHSQSVSGSCLVEISGSGTSPATIYTSTGVYAGIRLTSAGNCNYTSTVNVTCCPLS